METLFIWILGWVIFTLGFVFVRQIVFKKYFSNNWKYDLYEGVKWGIFSWIAIIFCIAVVIAMGFITLDEYITNKLKE